MSFTGNSRKFSNASLSTRKFSTVSMTTRKPSVAHIHTKQIDSSITASCGSYKNNVQENSSNGSQHDTMIVHDSVS